MYIQDNVTLSEKIYEQRTLLWTVTYAFWTCWLLSLLHHFVKQVDEICDEVDVLKCYNQLFVSEPHVWCADAVMIPMQSQKAAWDL